MRSAVSPAKAMAASVRPEIRFTMSPPSQPKQYMPAETAVRTTPWNRPKATAPANSVGFFVSGDPFLFRFRLCPEYGWK